jgi:hypothetical protein
VCWCLRAIGRIVTQLVTQAMRGDGNLTI